MEIHKQDSHVKPLDKRAIITATMIGSFFGPFMGAAVNIALPKISEEFSLDAIMMSWIAMSFLLSSAIFLVPLGKLADVVGRKKIFLYGNIFFLIASVLCTFSFNGFSLIIFRFLQGIGSAMVFGTSMALITSAFPPKERGKMIGLNVAVVYVGLSVAPVLGGILTQTFGWRSIFYLNIVGTLLIILLTYFRITSEWAEAKNEKFDFPGSLIYMLAMTALMYGFSKLPENIGIILTILGLIGLVFFVMTELKISFPVLNIQLFINNRIFAFSNLAALINYAATFAVTFILSLYLQYIKGLSPREAGLILIAQPIVMAIFAPLSGKFSDRFDAGIISSIGMSISVIGLIFLIFLSQESTNLYIIFCLIILGLGFGIFSSPNSNSVMSSVEKRYLGIASATLATMRLTGQMFSMAIATLIIHIFIGESKITPLNHDQFIHSMTVIFLVLTILCVFGVFASLGRGKIINNH